MKNLRLNQIFVLVGLGFSFNVASHPVCAASFTDYVAKDLGCLTTIKTHDIGLKSLNFSAFTRSETAVDDIKNDVHLLSSDLYHKVKDRALKVNVKDFVKGTVGKHEASVESHLLKSSLNSDANSIAASLNDSIKHVTGEHALRSTDIAKRLGLNDENLNNSLIKSYRNFHLMFNGLNDDALTHHGVSSDKVQLEVANDVAEAQPSKLYLQHQPLHKVKFTPSSLLSNNTEPIVHEPNSKALDKTSIKASTNALVSIFAKVDDTAETEFVSNIDSNINRNIDNNIDNSVDNTADHNIDILSGASIMEQSEEDLLELIKRKDGKHDWHDDALEFAKSFPQLRPYDESPTAPHNHNYNNELAQDNNELDGIKEQNRKTKPILHSDDLTNVMRASGSQLLSSVSFNDTIKGLDGLLNELNQRDSEGLIEKCLIDKSADSENSGLKLHIAFKDNQPLLAVSADELTASTDAPALSDLLFSKKNDESTLNGISVELADETAKQIEANAEFASATAALSPSEIKSGSQHALSHISGKASQTALQYALQYASQYASKLEAQPAAQYAKLSAAKSVAHNDPSLAHNANVSARVKNDRNHTFANRSAVAKAAGFTAHESQAAVDSSEVMRLRNVNIVSAPSLNDEAVSKTNNILSKLYGKEIDAQLLQRVLNELTRYYQDEGYTKAQAYLPLQSITEGKVDVLVASARLNALNVENLSSVNNDYLNYLLGRVHDEVNHPVKQEELNNSLLRLTDLGIFHVNGQFTENDAHGFNPDLDLQVSDVKPYDFTIFADNEGNESSGRYRFGGQLELRSPLGLADYFALFYARTNEKQNNVSVNYELPVNSHPTVFGLDFCYSNYELSGAYRVLGAKGHSSNFSAYMREPLYRDANNILNFKSGITYKSLTDEFETFDLTFKKHSLSTYAALNFTKTFLDKYSVSANSKFTYGHLYMDDEYELMEENNYFIFNFDSMFSYRIDDDTLYLAELKSQLASRTLDGSESFQIGGFNGLKAFETSDLAGDNGVLIKQSMVFTPLNKEKALTLTPHIEWGAVSNRGDDYFETTASTGLTVGFYKYGLNLALDYSTNIGTKPSYAQDSSRITFAASYAFF